MKNFILYFFILFASSSAAMADAVTFDANVSSPRVSMDESLQLTLTITGVSDTLDPVSLPVIDGFTAKYVGPSSSMSFVNVNGNSESHSEKSFIYNLFPNKVGHFQIPSITATIAGHTYTTQPIDVEVIQDSTQAQAQSANDTSNQSQGPTQESIKDKILIMLSVDKTNVYLNEMVPITIKLLVRDIPVRDIQFPQFDKQGFVADDFDKPLQSSQIVNGIKYDTVEFKTNIYPDHLGDLTLGPVQIQGNILYKNSQASPFNQENNLFGADIFNSFFESYATRPVTVTSQTLQLHVLPMPDNNRPQDFSGGIGQFDFQASVAPSQVKAGDPLTLKMTVRGNGNFKSLKMPVFQAPGFKTYEPQIKQIDDQKTDEVVIIPNSADIKQVPALQFSYFDTSINDYKTISQGPFAITVTAPNPDQDFKAIGFTDISRTTALPSSNQFSFGKVLNQGYQSLKKLCASLWFWMSLGIIFVAGISCFLWRRFQDRLENDPAFARRLKAIREAKQALLPAEGYVSTGKVKEFYALISKVLRDYLANKWHESAAALSVDEIIIHLKQSKMDEAHITQIKTILEQSDLVCFAGATFEANKMRADLAQTQDLIGHLEKTLK